MERFMEALYEKDRLNYAGSFVQGFVHNANGPLQNLTMLTEMLLAGVDVQDRLFKTNAGENEKWSEVLEKQRKRLTQMRDQIFNMAGDLREFMQLHEIERSGTEIDINALVSRMARVFRSDLFFKHQVQVELRLAKNLPHIKVPGRDLVPALFHLFQNAVTAMKTSQKREFVAETSMRDGEILVRIMDTGCGLNGCSETETCFGLFQSGWPQVENPGEFKRPHFGFGLFAARQLLSPYGCTVSLGEYEGCTSAVIRMPLPVKSA